MNHMVASTKSWLAGLLLLLAGSAVQAVPVVTQDVTTATHISNLDIGLAMNYDVTFVEATAPLTLSPCNDPAAVSGAECDLFADFFNLDQFDNQTGAEAAVDAINSALNDYSSAETVGPTASFSRTSYFVPFATCQTPLPGGGGTEDAICATRGNYSFSTWLRISDSVAELTLDTPVVFARFMPTTTAVPLPPAVVLFATGLLALLGGARYGRVET
jgi:hypothetical protein